MVRRPPTDTAFPPISVNAEHGYVAPVPRFPVRALFTDYAANGDVRAVIRVSLWSVQRTFVWRVRHGNDMRCPKHGSLGRRDAACVRQGEAVE